MKVSKTIVAPFLALALITGATGCGTAERGTSDLRACSEYEDEVLDLDDEGECFAEDDDEDSKKKKSKKKKSIGSTVKKSVTNKAKKSVSNKVKSGGGFKTTTRRK